MKQYKLLKDTPELKAGDMLEYQATTNKYTCGLIEYGKYSVENTPEWFREVKEVKEYDKAPAMTFINKHYIEKDKIIEILDRYSKMPVQIVAEFIEDLEELIK